MINSAQYMSSNSDIVIRMEDGAEHFTDASLPPDTDVRRQFAEWVDSGGVIEPYQPPAPPVLTRLAKADLWRRLTDEEGEAVNAVLLAAPIRLRHLYEAATYIDTTDEDYPALLAGVEAALGVERSGEVLAPNA